MTRSSKLFDYTQAVCDQLDTGGCWRFAEVVRIVSESAGRQEREWARETIRALPANASPADVLRDLAAAHRRRVKR